MTHKVRFRRATFLISTSVLLLGLLAHASSVEPAPVWKADLRQFGYESFPRRSIRPIRIAAAFTDARQLAIAWISPDTEKSTQRNPPTTGEAAHLHVVVLDANTGKKTQERQWATPYTGITFLLATGNSDLLICTNSSLVLLSANLEILRERGLPDNGNCASVHLRASPSGRTLLLSAAESRQVNIIDTTTFQVLFTWTEQGQLPVFVESITDRFAVGVCGEIECIRGFDTPWRPLQVAGVVMGKRVPSYFVADNVLVITGETATVTVVDRKLLWHISTAKRHSFFVPPVTSSGGDAFAMIEGRLRGLRSEPLDMYPFYADDHAIVYSLSNQHGSFSVKLKGTSPWTPWHVIDNVLALSPDGGALALISDGFLQFYNTTRARL